MKTYTTDALPNQLTAFLRDYSRVYRAILVKDYLASYLLCWE
jgi:hypothetical protein